MRLERKRLYPFHREMITTRRLKLILTGLGLLLDRGDWLEPDRLLGCAYPRRESALAAQLSAT